MCYMPSRDAALNVRVPASVKDSLLACAQVKGVTLSKYVVEVLSYHVVELGLITPLVAAGTDSSSSARIDTDYVRRQAIADCQRTYQKAIDKGLHPQYARAHVEPDLHIYAKRGIDISFDDLGVE